MRESCPRFGGCAIWHQITSKSDSVVRTVYALCKKKNEKKKKNNKNNSNKIKKK